MSTPLYCPECMGLLSSADGVTATCAIHGGQYKILVARPGSAVAAPPSVPAGMRCVQHPSVAATGSCRTCGAYFCATCDFALPGGVHLCPSCATTPATSLSPKRKWAMIGSFVLAAWCTFFLALLFSGAFASYVRTPAGRQALGLAFSFFVMVPSVVGMALGLGSMDRRLVNPPSLWVATLWNGLIVAVLLLIFIAGIIRRA